MENLLIELVKESLLRTEDLSLAEANDFAKGLAKEMSRQMDMHHVHLCSKYKKEESYESR